MAEEQENKEQEKMKEEKVEKKEEAKVEEKPEKETKGKTEKNSQKENPMRKIKIDKVVLSVGATGQELEKGFKLLQIVSDKKPKKTVSNKRIPGLGVRPGLELGAVVTIRKNPEKILNRLLVAIDNVLRKKQVVDNHFSFGIEEYLDIPGLEYQREVGIMGLDVTVVFRRTGKRVALKKIKRGKLPKRQGVSKEEIIKFMEDKFKTNFTGK